MRLDPRTLKLLLAESGALVVSDHEAPTAAALTRIPLYIDLGYVAEAYEICEALASSEPLAQCYLGHMDLSRRRQTEAHLARFETLLSHPDRQLAAHARLARGTSAAQVGDTKAALAELTEARALFAAVAQGAAGAIQVGKADVCLVMVLRMEGRHDEALELAEAAIARLEPLGPPAANPLSLLFAAAAGEHVRRGELYRARSVSWQAARIASVLTGAKSSGFVLFQHGRVEHALGNYRAARRVLEIAERLQGVLDPLARVATRILRFECLRAERDFPAALALMEIVLADPFLDSYEADRDEFVEEAVGLYLDLFDPESAARVLARAQTTNSLPTALAEKLESLIAAEKQAWGESTRARLRIDLTRGRLAGRDATGDVIAVEIGRDSTTRRLLMLLNGGRTTLDACVAACRDTQRTTEPASVRRRVRRALQRLEASGAVRMHDLSDKSLVGFADGLAIEVRR